MKDDIKKLVAQSKPIDFILSLKEKLDEARDNAIKDNVQVIFEGTFDNPGSTAGEKSMIMYHLVNKTVVDAPKGHDGKGTEYTNDHFTRKMQGLTEEEQLAAVLHFCESEGIDPNDLPDPDSLNEEDVEVYAEAIYSSHQQLNELTGKGSLDKIHKHYKDKERAYNDASSDNERQKTGYQYGDSYKKERANVLIKLRNHKLVKSQGGNLGDNTHDMNRQGKLANASSGKNSIIRSKYGKNANTQTYLDSGVAGGKKYLKTARNMTKKFTKEEVEPVDEAMRKDQLGKYARHHFSVADNLNRKYGDRLPDTDHMTTAMDAVSKGERAKSLMTRADAGTDFRRAKERLKKAQSASRQANPDAMHKYRKSSFPEKD